MSALDKFTLMNDGGEPRRCIYQVAVGPTKPLWEKCIESVAAYCQRHGIDHRVQREPLLRIRPSAKSNRSVEAVERLGYLPIYEKEVGLGLLGTEYHQLALIDADVWIKPDAPNIFDALGDADAAACVERFMPLTDAYREKLDRYEPGQYGPLGGVGLPFKNMGVLVMNWRLRAFCPEDPREFLARPEFQRFIDGHGAWKWSTDQTLLNWWLASCGAIVRHIGWQWNALYGAVRHEALAEAHAVHFFLSDHLRGDDPEAMFGKNVRERV